MAKNKETLLSESAVRRFMTLSGNGKAASKFVKESLKLAEEMPPQEEEDELGGDESELPVGDDLGGEEPELPAPGGGNEDLMRKVVEAVADVLGVAVDVSGGGGEEEGMGGELDLPGGEEGMTPDEDEELENALQEANIELDEEDKNSLKEQLVKAVSRRVAKRLLEAQKKSRKPSPRTKR